jgi:hypothetical protein
VQSILAQEVTVLVATLLLMWYLFSMFHGIDQEAEGIRAEAMAQSHWI